MFPKEDLSRYLFPALIVTLTIMLIQTVFLGVLIYGQSFSTSSTGGVSLISNGQSPEMVGGC